MQTVKRGADNELSFRHAEFEMTARLHDFEKKSQGLSQRAKVLRWKETIDMVRYFQRSFKNTDVRVLPSPIQSEFLGQVLCISVLLR